MNILEQNKVAILNTDPQKSREFFEKYKANNKVRLFYNRFDWFYYVENGEVDCWPECPPDYNHADYDWQPPKEEYGEPLIKKRIDEKSEKIGNIGKEGRDFYRTKVFHGDSGNLESSFVLGYIAGYLAAEGIFIKK